MFIGHAALGFAAKRVAPRANLGWLLTAPFLADLLWPVFLLLGWEKVRIDPGNTAVTPLDFVSYPWSHSLLMLLVWSVAFAGAYALWAPRDRRGAWVIGALVVSHWVLDWITHRADMPLWPGGPLVGLGLWYSKPATVVVEVLMIVIGLGSYLVTTYARGRLGYLSLWSLVALLAFAYYGNLNGPPPPSEHVLAQFALVGFVFIPWAMWIESTRAVRP